MPLRPHWYPPFILTGSYPTGEPLLQEKTPCMPLPCDISIVHTSMGSETNASSHHPASLQHLCGGRSHPENGNSIPCYATSAPEANPNDVCAQQFLCIPVNLDAQTTVENDPSVHQ